MGHSATAPHTHTLACILHLILQRISIRIFAAMLDKHTAMLDKHTAWCEQAGALVLIDMYMLPWPRLSSSSLRHHAAQLACHRKVIRLVAVTAAVVAYAQLRSWLAGDHLVRIYRKVS